MGGQGLANVRYLGRGTTDVGGSSDSDAGKHLLMPVSKWRAWWRCDCVMLACSSQGVVSGMNINEKKRVWQASFVCVGCTGCDIQESVVLRQKWEARSYGIGKASWTGDDGAYHSRVRCARANAKWIRIYMLG